jgi:hypothetical protein
MTDEKCEFAPILLGPGLSPQSFDVASRLAPVPTLSEITARLGALPRATLQAVIAAEPAVYQAMAGDARETASYLRSLATAFDQIAARLAPIEVQP